MARHVIIDRAPMTEALYRIQNNLQSEESSPSTASIRNRRSMEEIGDRCRSADQNQRRNATCASIEDEAVIVVFRRHTLLPLDDSLNARHPMIPHPTCSARKGSGVE